MELSTKTSGGNHFLSQILEGRSGIVMKIALPLGNCSWQKAGHWDLLTVEGYPILRIRGSRSTRVVQSRSIPSFIEITPSLECSIELLHTWQPSMVICKQCLGDCGCSPTPKDNS